jgi:hypothetical protein
MSMSSGEDWLLQPVIAGMCKYESLKDGTLDLGDVARMSDALAVSNENQARMAARE